MAVYHESFIIKTADRPEFYDVTGQVQEVISRSGIRDGLVVVYSQHTTCSVIIQEESHDTNYNGTKFILQDLLDVYDSLVPRCTSEGQYMHPGPKHVEYAIDELDEPASWALNTDAHLRSCMLGRSESIPIIDGRLELGLFGQIYFVDFDGLRERDRTVRVQIVG